MALNRQTFKTRTLTAAVFVVVMCAGLFINHWTFFLLFSVIHFGCWIEYQKLVELIDPNYKQITPFHKYGVMIAGWCIMLYFTSDVFHIFDLRLHELGWWIGLIFLFVLPMFEILFAKQIHLKNIGHSFFGLVYISLSFGLLMNMADMIAISVVPGFYNDNEIAFLPLLIIFTLWINDTMAYIVGSFIGKTPFSKISPKKTWEGTIGGIILSVVIMGFLAGWYWNKYIDIAGSINNYHWFIIAAIAAIAGTAGDLLESKLKRLANVKDSGHIMPGHGGFLDRFDSLLVAVPFVWLYVVFFL